MSPESEPTTNRGKSWRICTPARHIVRTNAWKIYVHAKGVILYWDLPPDVEPFVQWGEE